MENKAKGSQSMIQLNNGAIVAVLIVLKLNITIAQYYDVALGKLIWWELWCICVSMCMYVMARMYREEMEETQRRFSPPKVRSQ